MVLTQNDLEMLGGIVGMAVGQAMNPVLEKLDKTLAQRSGNADEGLKQMSEEELAALGSDSSFRYIIRKAVGETSNDKNSMPYMEQRPDSNTEFLTKKAASEYLSEKVGYNWYQRGYHIVSIMVYTD